MTKLDRLGGVLREVEGPLGGALREHSPFTQWIDSDLQLTYEQCGIATAALQLYLSESANIVTYRHITTFRHPALEPGMGPKRHVLLTTEHGWVVDPTYTRMLDFVGLDTALAQEFDDMKSLFPERKIAHFDGSKSDEFADGIAEHALNVRGKMRVALGSRVLSFHRSSVLALEDARECSVHDAYRSIWRLDEYEPFTVEAQEAGYGDGKFIGTIRRIVDVMK